MWRRIALLFGAVWCLAGCAVQTAALREHAPPGLPPQAELAQTSFHPQTDLQCGPAALATALGAMGVEASPAALADEVFLPARGGSLQLEMLAGVRRHGAVATRIPGTLAAVLREVAAGHVVVVLQNLGLSLVPLWHYAVVVGYDLPAGEVILRSGTTQRDRVSLRTFEYTWARSDFWAFVATPPGQWPATAQESSAVEAATGFERVGTPAQSLQVYETANARWPASLPLAIGLGNAAYALGDKPRAAQVFERAADEHDHAAAWFNLAQVRLELGQADAARAAAQRALQAPGDPRWAARARELLAQPTMRP